MYKITPQTGTAFIADAIEFLTVDSGILIPTEQENADGFNAMTINHVSPTEESYTTVTYTLPDHSLLGGEPIATFEDLEVEEPSGGEADPEGELAKEIVRMIEEIL